MGHVDKISLPPLKVEELSEVVEQRYQRQSHKKFLTSSAISFTIA